MSGGRVHLVVRDTGERSRLTVLFRLPLAVPHLILLSLWSLVVLVLLIPMWVATLVLGGPPKGLHELFGSYVRYSIRVGAYLFLAANPWPVLDDTSGYDVDIVLPEPERQNRWTVAFRLLLGVPVLLLTTVLGGSVFAWTTVALGAGVAMAAAFLGWFACLVLGRMPSGLRDLVAYCLGYAAQASAYLFLVTGRYPDSDPDLVVPRPSPPPHPVRLVLHEDARRSRLTVFFRLLLALPHLVWLALWGIAALLAAIAGWFATLVRGRLPLALHRFLAAYVRYVQHVYAFLFLVGNPFPGFTGTAGSYPVDAEIDPPERQHRLRTLFRLVLVVPAVLLAGALSSALWTVGFLAWFAALVTGRMPRGLAHLGAAVLRYSTQLNAYLLLLTDRYPHATPSVTPPPPPTPAPPEPPAPADAVLPAPVAP